MKKAVLFVTFALFSWSTTCSCAYVVLLRNGHRFFVQGYWEESGQIQFYSNGGAVGISKAVIDEIREHPGVTEDVAPKTKGHKTLGKIDIDLSTPHDGTIRNDKGPNILVPSSRTSLQRKAQLEALFERTVERFRQSSENREMNERSEAMKMLVGTSQELAEMNDLGKETKPVVSRK